VSPPAPTETRHATTSSARAYHARARGPVRFLCGPALRSFWGVHGRRFDELTSLPQNDGSRCEQLACARRSLLGRYSHLSPEDVKCRRNSEPSSECVRQKRTPANTFCVFSRIPMTSLRRKPAPLLAVLPTFCADGALRERLESIACRSLRPFVEPTALRLLEAIDLTVYDENGGPARQVVSNASLCLPEQSAMDFFYIQRPPLRHETFLMSRWSALKTSTNPRKGTLALGGVEQRIRSTRTSFFVMGQFLTCCAL
jgi:hypothetical protein